MNFINGPNCMVDLETSDTLAWSAIRSIGACVFDANGITRTFYQNVDPASCVAVGMSQCDDTVRWWAAQGEEARRVLEPDQVDIRVALKRFADWYGKEPMPTWGNGANFDNVILANAFRLCEMDVPWPYFMDRCYRTVRKMAVTALPAFTGVKHYSLDDALYQASCLIQIHNDIISGKRRY